MNKTFLIFILISAHIARATDDSLFLKKTTPEPKYCKSRIVGMSPNKVISIGYDCEFGQTLKSSDIGSYDKDEEVSFVETTKFKQVAGLRFTAKVPIINKPKLIWLMGLNYWNAKYLNAVKDNANNQRPFSGDLSLFGLTTTGISSSVFKPLNAKQFIIVAASADLNGNFKIGKLSFSNPKYSYAAMYGQKVHDRKNWAIGLSRSYGGGQSTILPVIMFNYTSPSKKWGTEILLPSRAWYRYSINKNSLCRLGFELEGASYRLKSHTYLYNMELRRGQLRTKVEYQCKLYKSFWLAVQTGYCVVLNYNLDYLGSDKNDFHRGLLGNNKYAMINDLSNFMFLNLSINFVSL